MRSGQWQEALVLGLRSYGESDRIVTLLTHDQGVIKAFARGARRSRKRFGSRLELFACIKTLLVSPRQSQSLWQLHDTELVNPHFGVRSDLPGFLSLSYVVECLLGLLGQGDPHPQVYEWLNNVLNGFDCGIRTDRCSVSMVYKMLELCGYRPRCQMCAQCSAKLSSSQVFFGFDRGGLLCHHCAPRTPGRWVSRLAFDRLEFGLVLDACHQEELREVLHQFICFILGWEPKSYSVRRELQYGYG